MALVAQTEGQPNKARRKSQAPGAGEGPSRSLAEVFGARPSDVEEMILARLEERSWSKSRMGLNNMGKRIEGLNFLMWRVRVINEAYSAFTAVIGGGSAGAL